MKRQTSIDTYNKIKSSGLLSRMRWKVYDFLYSNGPMTCRELMMAMHLKEKKAFVVAGSSLSTRFSELERQGVVQFVRERPCKETGRMSIEWDVTSNLPIKFETPKRLKCNQCNGKGYFERKENETN